MKRLWVIVFVISLSKGQVFYVSPGIQFGRSSNENFFSFQLTFGMMSQKQKAFPGITVGRRKYFKTKKEFSYFDFQASFGMGGLGRGWMWDSAGESVNKTKLWVVLPIMPLALISYDYIGFKEPSGKHHWGVFGVLPIPTGKVDAFFPF